MPKRPNAKNRINAPGGFAGVPRIVMRHPDYKGLSGGAVKLLLDLSFQYKGKNNGDLTVAYSVLKDRGCGAKDTIKRAVKELLDVGMIIQTRPGRFVNPGAVCALYALTWAPIDECASKQLILGPTTTPTRKFSTENNEKPCPETRLGSSQKLGRDRRRNLKGQFSPTQKLGRLRVVT